MRKFFTLVLLLVAIGQYSNAQKVTNSTLNFKELAAYEAAHPELIKHCSKCAEEEQKREKGREADKREEGNESWEEIDNPNMPFPAGAVIKKQELGPKSTAPIKMVPSKTPAQQWIGYTDPGNTIPPDTHGAVGLNHVITATNDYIQIHAKYGGAILARATISGFTGVAGTCDPYMTYDPTANRWVFSAINCSNTVDNPVILMVSATSDPLGAWRRITWLTTPTGTSIFLDHPYLGFDNTKIVVSGRRFAPGFLGTSLFLVDKAAMYAGTTITFGTNAQQIDKTSADGDAPLPVTVYDPPFSTVGNPSPGTFYILQGWNGTSIRLTTVTGNIPTATWNTGAAAVFPTSALPAWNNGSPGNVAEQMVETRGLATNDARISCGVMMNGKIWASHHISFPATGTVDRVAVQWWQLDGTPGANFGKVLQNGRVGGTTAHEWKWFSSIAVNKNEDVLIGYTASTNASRVNAAYVTRSAATAPNTTDDEVIYHAGEERYWKDFSSGRARWGDYSHSSLDPANSSLWTIQEYAAPGNGVVPPDNNSRYGVWWANVVPASVPNLSIADVTKAEGNSATTPFTFTVTLDAPAPAGGVTFDITTVDGTATATTDAATAPADYATKTLTTQTIAAGATTYTFTVDVVGDAVQELDETFGVSLANVTNAFVTKSTALGTITNDDVVACATPTVAAPTVVQPSCTSSNGSITYNATGIAPYTLLEYSLNGGAYQYSNVFPNLAPGSYTISVRPHVQPTCVTTSAPIVLVASTLAPVLTVVAESGASLCSGDNTLLRAGELAGVVAGTPLLNLTATSVNSAITFNFRNNNAYPVAITSLASVINNAEPINTAVYYKASPINGAVGPITAANGWYLAGTGLINGVGGIQTFVSGLNLPVPAGATYGIIVQAITVTGTPTVVYNNVATAVTASAGGCDIVTGPNIGYSGAPIPAEPTTTVRRFIGSVSFQKINTIATGTYAWSPAAGLSSTTGNPVGASPLTTTTYTVTHTDAGCVRQASILINVNQRPTITTQPVNTTVCENAATTISAITAGYNTTFAWQVSTNAGVTWANVPAAAPYSGVTTSTLSISPAAIGLANNQYRLVVNGSGSCAGVVVISNAVTLSVTPAPVITVTAANTCGGVAGLSATKLKASGAAISYTWSPVAGLFSDPLGTIPYVAGTKVDSVYAAPTVTTIYTATGLSGTTGCNGTASVTVNYSPVAPTVSPASVTMCLGDAAKPLAITSSLAPVTVTAASGPISVVVPDLGTGAPATANLVISGIPAGATIAEAKITFTMTHTFVGDMDINIVAPNGQILNMVGGLDNGTGGNSSDNFTNTALSNIGTVALSGFAAPRTGTFKVDGLAGYGPAGYLQATGTTWANLLPNANAANGTWTIAMGDWGAGDVGTLTSWKIEITYGIASAGIWSPIAGLFNDAAASSAYVVGTPATTVYAKPAVTTNYAVTVSTGTCTSPARIVPVVVNNPIVITAQPVNASVCADKAATFTVGVTGTAPVYQWQVSTDNGNTFNNVTNGGVYSGATSATLTITAPPVSMNGYIYRSTIAGAAPCGSVTSLQRSLTVNPLPTVVLSASPYKKLFPGLKTTLFSTVAPAANTYTWLRNGVAVTGASSGSLLVDVDGLGDYTLRVTDVNGCINTSNLISLTDSTSGKVFIYPNPNGGQFQVRYYSIINNTGLPRGINVYDARGKRVLTQNYTITAPYSRMDVNLSNYSTGVYWIEVVDVSGNRLAMGRAEVLR